jgi:hypothetical protein
MGRSPFHYLDIETTGLDPARDDIITVQYRNIEFDGTPAGPLVVLRSWESSEREVVERTWDAIRDKWRFIPVGFNLDFERAFLHHKLRLHLGLDCSERLYREGFWLDLQQLVVLMQGGRLKGSGLDDWSPKRESGASVPEWHRAGEHDRIVRYVEEEADAFLALHRALIASVPAMREAFLARKTWPVVLGGRTV